jgi:prepilin-type N-terminal cleavage/methylation domain-containing protein
MPNPQSPIPRGYTLVELLVASVLTLLLMTAVVQVFSRVGNGISGARRALEQFGRLRDAEAQLRMDLAGATATMLPPQRLEAAPGYFEIIAGWSAQQINANWFQQPDGGWSMQPSPVDASGNADTTVGRRGHVLMFTTRSTAQPFVGRCAGSTSGTIQSYVAEVAWFLRGRTLHRRVLLVVTPAPAVQSQIGASPIGFYANNDISVHVQNGNLVFNTLADLTKREYRFAHPLDQGFPFDAARWGQLGLPTLRECSSSSWCQGGTALLPAPNPPPQRSADIWGENKSNDVALLVPEHYPAVNPEDATRLADDVVLNNVIGFDVKVWDNKAQQYVELGQPGAVSFGGTGIGPAINNGSYPNPLAAPTYDTWSSSYENEGINFGNSGNHQPDPRAGKSTNGFDDDQSGVVDDQSEWLTSPPYLAPLRGIQVKIRCFEPDSRQVREVTVEQDFLPK